jgi:hypothetical protein
MMTHPASKNIVSSDLNQHPAVRAWNALEGGGEVPDCIEVLQEVKKARLYRLLGVGFEGSAVIAKQSRTGRAAIERTIYTQVLPHVPVPSLRYYGVTEEEGEFSWLFLEDAGKEAYSSALNEHRTLAAHWLGLLHTFSERTAPRPDLPERGPAHYLGELRGACDALARIQSRPGVTSNGMSVLRAADSQLETLETRWNQIEQFCEQMPKTVVHGDLAEKNVRLLGRDNRVDLLVYDWEIAGWGPPAIDLAQHTLNSITPDIPTYHSVIRSRWPHLSMPILGHLASIGTIFRLLDGIYWEVYYITKRENRAIPEQYIRWTIDELSLYRDLMNDALQAVAWGRLGKDA